MVTALKKFHISNRLILGLIFLSLAQISYSQNIAEQDIRAVAQDFLKHSKRFFREKRYMDNVVSVMIDTTSLKDKGLWEIFFIRTHPIERFLITPSDTLGSRRIQVSYVEEGNVLFFWHDPAKPLTEDVVDMLVKYNFCEFRNESYDFLYGENFVNDDSPGNVEYIIRYDSPRKIKRRVLK